MKLKGTFVNNTNELYRENYEPTIAFYGEDNTTFYFVIDPYETAEHNWKEFIKKFPNCAGKSSFVREYKTLRNFIFKHKSNY